MKKGMPRVAQQIRALSKIVIVFIADNHQNVTRGKWKAKSQQRVEPRWDLKNYEIIY